MGNKFGNFSTEEEVSELLISEGYTFLESGLYCKKSEYDGKNILVRITSYRVDGEYSEDGLDYEVFQYHFI